MNTERDPACLEAEALLRDSTARVVSVGPRPWHQRALTRLRLWVPMAALSIVCGGVGAGATMLVMDYAKNDTQTTPSSVAAPVEARAAGSLLGSFIPSNLVKDKVNFDNVTATVKSAPQSGMFHIEPTDNGPMVAKKLMAANEPFMALAVSLESLELHPYRDACGLNVGMGYCITIREKEYGPARIQQDLRHAGLPETTIAVLMGNDRKAQDAVRFTPDQAVRLLKVSEADYRAIARNTIGAGTFDKLAKHRQAALTWLAYNTGSGFLSFKTLHTAVRNGDTLTASESMTPFFSLNGVRTANARAGSWLQTAYWSESAMKAAIERPAVLEEAARRGQTPLEMLIPKEVGLLALRGQLPASPYTIHGLVGSPNEAVVVASIDPSQTQDTPTPDTMVQAFGEQRVGGYGQRVDRGDVPPDQRPDADEQALTPGQALLDQRIARMEANIEQQRRRGASEVADGNEGTLRRLREMRANGAEMVVNAEEGYQQNQQPVREAPRRGVRY